MQLGPYNLLSRLGAGGMGEVWRAEDTKLLRQVAVKILSNDMAGDADSRARLLREARTAARLNHPNIATIYAVDEHEGTLYIAMELVEGEPLSKLIEARRLQRIAAVRIARFTAEALSEAHAKGIIHRDVKPENIIVSSKTVKVLDFGIAKRVDVSSDSGRLTEHGMILGTPHYMSPEQALGKTLDCRSDIFSLGVVLYESLSGALPFTADTVTASMMQTIVAEPVDIARVAIGIPEELAEIVRKCLQKKTENRYQTVAEVAEALARIRVADAPMPHRPESTPTLAVPKVQPPPAKPETATAKLRALIVDDDAVTRALLGGILGQHDVEFDEANNGAEAIQRLKQKEYELLFLDLLMPRIDGWGVLDYLRGHRKEHLDVFLITGVHNQRLSTVDQEMVSGMIDKPIDRSQIGEVVERRIARAS